MALDASAIEPLSQAVGVISAVVGGVWFLTKKISSTTDRIESNAEGIAALDTKIDRQTEHLSTRQSAIEAKIDGTMMTQGKLEAVLVELSLHQKEINGGIARHMQDDAVALSELRSSVARLEGRLEGMLFKGGKKDDV